MQTRKLVEVENEAQELYLVRQNFAHSERVPLRHGLKIGRSLNCDLIIEDAAVSQLHAIVEVVQGRYLVKDQASTNGTWLNSNRVQVAQVQLGDQIRWGESVWTVLSNLDQPVLKTHNSQWAQQLDNIHATAQSDHPILLLGESGTGKDVLANQIHMLSKRRRGPMITVNCSALTDQLIESELFGHKKGSFTGADADRPGAFLAARGGTLFLDEIGDMPINAQPKLLRALENREVKPVGHDRSFPTDVRIIAATHRNLEQSVRDGRFRLDLFYRLNVIELKLPSLRERGEDFRQIVSHLNPQVATRLTPLAWDRLRSYNWPGNIRELKNFILRLSLQVHSHLIDGAQIDELLPRVEPAQNSLTATDITNSQNYLKGVERRLICEKLIENRGNQRRTAEQLGMAKSTLNDRIKSYGIDIHQLINSQGRDYFRHDHMN